VQRHVGIGELEARVGLQLGPTDAQLATDHQQSQLIAAARLDGHADAEVLGRGLGRVAEHLDLERVLERDRDLEFAARQHSERERENVQPPGNTPRS